MPIEGYMKKVIRSETGVVVTEYAVIIAITVLSCFASVETLSSDGLSLWSVVYSSPNAA